MWLLLLILYVLFMNWFTSDNGYSGSTKGTCPKCNGSGTKIGFTVGLSNKGNVPAYYSTTCKRCSGRGYV